MRNTLILFQKEWMELIRHYKWLWVPLVFLLLGISQPITMKFLPDILASTGSLPEGTMIQLPTPTSGEILGQVLSQFNTVGILLLVLATMGTISSEVRSGVAGAILTKPVSPASYLAAKWAAAMCLTIPAFSIGYAGAWYYTVQLFEPISAFVVLTAAIVALGWFCFIVTLAVVMSLWLASGAAAAFSTLAIALLFGLINLLWKDSYLLNPSKLIEGAQYMLMEQPPSFSVGVTVFMTLLLSGLLFAIGLWSATKRQSWLPADKGSY